jgi:hypothetical protein
MSLLHAPVDLHLFADTAHLRHDGIDANIEPIGLGAAVPLLSLLRGH